MSVAQLLGCVVGLVLALVVAGLVLVAVVGATLAFLALPPVRGFILAAPAPLDKAVGVGAFLGFTVVGCVGAMYLMSRAATDGIPRLHGRHTFAAHFLIGLLRTWLPRSR